MERLRRIIKQLMNEVIYLKKNVGKSFSSRNIFNPQKKKRTNQRPSSPVITNCINFETYAMETFYKSHHANHSEKTCREFKNMFKVFVSPSRQENEEDDDEEEEVKEEEEKDE